MLLQPKRWRVLVISPRATIPLVAEAQGMADLIMLTSGDSEGAAGTRGELTVPRFVRRAVRGMRIWRTVGEHFPPRYDLQNRC